MKRYLYIRAVLLSDVLVVSCVCFLFFKRCFTFMDRGFVFKQINNYMNCFMPGDPKVKRIFCFSLKGEFASVQLSSRVGGSACELYSP